MSTAAVRLHVPNAWFEQTRPGGLVVTPWGTSFHNGSLLCLRVEPGGVGTGRFRGNLAFMRLCAHRGPAWVDDENVDEADSGHTTLHSSDIGQAADGFDAGFAIGLFVPDCRVHVDHGGQQHMLWLSDGESLARVTVRIGEGRHEVRQRGPRRLWDELEVAYRWWRDAGEPGHTRFGLTVTPGAQWVWLDEPSRMIRTEMR